MVDITTCVIILIVLAIIFDFVNGFHDASNIVATMISSRSISPGWALLLASIGEFVGPFLFGTAVAKTIGKDIVDPSIINIKIIFAALIGSIFWNLFTWYSGLPSSSSHALIGGVTGAVIAAKGIEALKLDGFFKVVMVLVTSPFIGLAVGYLFQTLCKVVACRCTPGANKYFKFIQIFSATGLALSHGSNDAQKTMGIITMLLVTAGWQKEFLIPTWVIIAAAMAMSLGTACGGWRIIKTVGNKIYKMQPIHSFAAQSTAASVILGAALVGGPVSTTHVVSTAIMGVGSADRVKAVNWGTAFSIISTWIITIPAAAMVSMLCYIGVHVAKTLFLNCF